MKNFSLIFVLFFTTYLNSQAANPVDIEFEDDQQYETESEVEFLSFKRWTCTVVNGRGRVFTAKHRGIGNAQQVALNKCLNNSFPNYGCYFVGCER